jgi:hypothetical protein
VADITIPNSDKEPACSKECVTMSGVVSPSPRERFKKHYQCRDDV